MSIIIIATLILAYVCFPVVRGFFTHPFAAIYYACIDIYKYFKEKRYNNAPYGQIRCFIADNAVSFGCGKTLSSVRYLVNLYNKYDGLTVWAPDRKKYVTQRIHILSNVDFLTIPFEHLINLEQFVQETNEDFIEKDIENDELTVTYLYIDEASSQMNSRDFKNNFSPLFISRLLTSRHVRAGVFLTSQRAGMVDKLMREVTNLYVGCRLIWRFQINSYYDAFEIENATQPSLIKPLRTDCWFVRDRDFKRYDTFASVQELKKRYKDGEMLSDEEILALQGTPDVTNMEVVRRPSKWFINKQKKMTTLQGKK